MTKVAVLGMTLPRKGPGSLCLREKPEGRTSLVSASFGVWFSKFHLDMQMTCQQVPTG